MAMSWWWAYAPYLDEPEKQAESALKAGYVKVCCKDDVDEEVARLKEEVAAMRKCRDLLRQKYKRCLAMAKWCKMCHRELLTRACLPTKQNWNRHEEWRYFTNYWGRNERRWRNLAERLKERL